MYAEMPSRNGSDLIQCKLALSNHNNTRETKSKPLKSAQIAHKSDLFIQICKIPTSALNQDVYEADAGKIEIVQKWFNPTWFLLPLNLLSQTTFIYI